MFFLGAIYVINEIKFFYNFGNALIVTLDHSEPINTTQVLVVAITFFSFRNKNNALWDCKRANGYSSNQLLL